MLSKNNFKEKLRKMSAKTEKFSIRKLSVGAASVLIGLTFMGINGQTVHADTNNGQKTNEGQDVNVDEASNAVHNAKEVTVENGVKAADASQAAKGASQNSAENNNEDKKQAAEPEKANSVEKQGKSTTVENGKDTLEAATTKAGKKDADVTENKADNTAIQKDGNKQEALKTNTFNPGEHKNPITKDAVKTNKVQTTPVADVNAWNYDGNADNLKITGYKNPSQINGADIVIPNSAELRAAGKLNDGVEAQITYGAVHNLVTNGAKSITINAGQNQSDRLKAVDGISGATSGIAFHNGWTTAFNNGSNSNLESLDLGGLDVSQVDTFDSMMSHNHKLKSVKGLDTWDVSNVYNFGHMFHDDPNLTTVQGLDNWNTASVKFIDFMFNGDSNLGSDNSTLDLSGWHTDGVINAAYMFNNASAITSVGDLSNWKLNNATNTSNMFNEAKKLTTLGNIGGWFTQGSKNTNTSHMFSNAQALTSVGDLSNWNLANVTDASYMFNDARKLNGIGNIGGWFPQGSKIVNMAQMFNDAYSLTSVGDISGWDTSNTTNMGQLFREATSLKTIGNLDNWNVSNVTYMAGMFQGVPASSIGDLSNWDTNKVTNMDYMFAQTPNLTNIGNLNATDHTNGRKGWNTSGALEVAFRMFMGSGIKNLDVSGWKFSDSLSSMNQNTYLGATTMANRNNAIFASLVHPATITMNGWQDSVTSNLHAADFDGNQPLIVISDSSNLQNLNSDEIKEDQLGIDRNSSNAHVGAKGHVANTVTFVSTSDKNTPIAHQQKKFVFANQDTLNTALDKIKTDDNINTVPYGNGTLENKYVSNSGAYLNGKHNATGTDYGQNTDYGKIAGTYSVQTEQDVTQDLIRQNDPHLQKATATYRVVERFPDYYTGEGVMNAQAYANTIGDSAHASSYAGYKYKIVLSQPITAYRAATKNLLTGDINYDGPYSLANSDLNGSVGFTSDNTTYTGTRELDHPDHYNVSADPTSYYSPEIDERNNHVLSYTFSPATATTGPSFTYDLINGYGTDENTVTFNKLPASQTFYINYTAQTEDVTQTEIDNGTYPDAHKKTATYQVIERFPSDYAGALNADGSLKSGYTRNGDFIERVIANQTVTAYQTATKNLATGDISYSTDFNCKYVKFASTTPDKSVVDPSQDLWSHQYSAGDETLINKSPVDNPAGFNISADPASYVTSENDANGKPMLKISYDAANHTFDYDFMNGTSDGNASDQLKFNALPASHNFYIDYTAKQQSVKIQFIDTENNNQPVPNSEITKSGTTDQTIQLDLTDNNIPAGYELAEGQTLPTDYKFTAGNNQTITVKLKHKVSTIDGDNIPEGGQTPDGQPLTDSDFKQTITRTITAELPSGNQSGNQNLSQHIDITRTAQYDEVTKKVTSWGDWSKGNFAAVNVPQVPGYTAQINGQDAPSQISAVSNVTDGYTDPKIKITYKANQQSITINYKDADGNTIGTATVSGTTGETKDNNVSNHVPAGWKLVDGQTIPSQTNFTYGKDGQPSFHDINVKIEHATVTVQPNDPKTPSDNLPDNPGEKYPEGVGRDDLNKTITRTITITKPDGTPVNKTQTLTFKRTATVDEVTKKVTYSDWVPADGSADSFGQVDVPEIPGYTRSQDNVPAKRLTNDEITNWKDTPINISYTPNEQTGKIEYVDGDGNVIGTTDLTGVTGGSVAINPVAPNGWTIVPGQNIPTSVTATADGVPTVRVKVVPVSTDNDDNGGSDNTIPSPNTPTEPNKGHDQDQQDKPATKPSDNKKPEKPAKPNKTKPNKSKNSKTNKSKSKANKVNSPKAKHNNGNHASSASYRGNHGQAGTLLRNKSVSGNHGSEAPSQLNGKNGQSKAAQLPQTGEHEVQAGLLGAILAGMGLTTALGAKKRKKN